jgi:diguanylate cyclase (GGDEF)-like protein
MEITPTPKDEGEVARLALQAIRGLLFSGQLPGDLPEAVRDDPAFKEVAGQLDELYRFTLALANGDLNHDLKMKGRAAGALKSLQANLRHLTWQAQRIASGDLSQRVQFMGEFAEAFKTMVEEIHLLQSQLREQAIRDSLTGCYNRRYLDETLGREFSRAQREAYPVCLVMADLDHFKLVNDTYGHQAGDAFLKALGGLLRSHTRAGDIVCRYGGEEFVIVLPNMQLEDAFQRANNWRLEFRANGFAANTFAAKPFSNQPASGEHGRIRVTVSMGVASFPLHGASSEQVLKRADEAMYAAKEAGRDCVRAPGAEFHNRL